MAMRDLLGGNSKKALLAKLEKVTEALETNQKSRPELIAAADSVYDGTRSAEYVKACAAVDVVDRDIETGKRVFATTQKQLAEIEAEEAKAADAALRKKTVSKEGPRWDAFEAEVNEIAEHIAHAAKEAEHFGNYILDVKALAAYFTNGAPEIAANIKMLGPIVRNYHAAILKGGPGAPPPAIPVAPVLVPTPAREAEQRTAFFTLQPCKFEHNGSQQVARFQTVSLTKVQQTNALRMEAVCALDDPRVPDLRKKSGVFERPMESHCFDLDANTRPSGVTIFDLQSQKPQYRPPAGLRPDHTTDLRLPKAAARTELPAGFEEHPRMRDGAYQMKTDGPKKDDNK